VNRSTNTTIFSAPRSMILLIILVATGIAPALAQDPDIAAPSVEAAPTQPGTAERLEAVMERIVERFPGRIGVYAEHIESGIAAGVDPDTPYGMASTYKVPILVEMMARVESGEWSLDMPIDLTIRDQHIGSGLLADLWAPGLTLSLKNLATMMIILSDNSATDMLIDRVGAAEVTARMRSLGLENIRVDRTTLELILDYNGIDYAPVAEASLAEIISYRQKVSMSPEEVAAAREVFYEGPEDKATAREMTTLLIEIAEGRALEKESCDVILEILERTRTGANRLRGQLPPGTRLAHKTGTIGRILDDVGIIYLPDGLGRVAISVFTLADEPDGERAEAAIADLARTVYDFFLFNAPATEGTQ
jgi:beta-lactamase class A